MTGTPQVTASTITLAPPSITLEITIALAFRMRRRVSPCVRPPSQRYRRTDGHARACSSAAARAYSPVRVADMDEPHRGVRRQPRDRAHRRQRILLCAHVADQDHVEASLRRRAGLERGSGLEDHAAFAPMTRIELVERGLLQHDQVRRPIERAPRGFVDADVAIEIRPGEHDDQRAIGIRFGEARDRVGRAARMQRDHARGGRRRVRPLIGDVDVEPLAEKARPSVCGPPVAVVRLPQRRADDRESWLPRLHRWR